MGRGRLPLQMRVEPPLLPTSHPGLQEDKRGFAVLPSTHLPTATACASLSSQSLLFSGCSQGWACPEVSGVCLICTIMHALSNYSVCLAFRKGSIMCFPSTKSQSVSSCHQANSPDPHSNIPLGEKHSLCSPFSISLNRRALEPSLYSQRPR